MSCCVSCPPAHNAPTNTHVLLLPTTKLLQEPVLQQHHKCSLVHTYRSKSRSLLPLGWMGQRPGGTERAPTSQGKTGSCSSGSPVVLPGHCHRAASRMHSAPWFCWKPSPSHLAPCTETLGLSSSLGVKAREPCHSIGMEREQPRTCSSKMVPSENCCRLVLRITPTSTNPLGLHTALTISENTVRGWRMTVQTTHLHSLTMTSLNFLPHALYCWSLTHNPLFLQLCNAPHTCLFSSMVPLQLCQTFTILSTFSYHPVAPDRPKDALSELFLSHWKTAESFCE